MRINDEQAAASTSGSDEVVAENRADDDGVAVHPEGGEYDAGPSLLATVESLLFVADRPLALTEIARLLDVTKRTVEKAVDELGEHCVSGGRGLRLQRRNGSVQMVTSPEAADAVQRFLGIEHAAPLSRAALESLSIIAYRQPITRPELDDFRGVNSDGVLRTLIARDLVELVGRRETVGLPIEYGTTYRFLEYFGLTSLDDLPPIEMSGLPESALPDGEPSIDGDDEEMVGAVDVDAHEGIDDHRVDDIADTVEAHAVAEELGRPS